MNKGAMIAGAVATLFLSGAAIATAEDKAGGDKVMCAGINACKGQSACAGGSGGNSCHGANSCKGKGVTETTAADCTSKGGKVLPKN
jgi:hypothetical protein